MHSKRIAQSMSATAMILAAAASAIAHPGPRIWIGSAAGRVATFASNNDLNPVTFTASRVFVGGVDEKTLLPNGRLDEFPVSGTGVYATEFPGYQVRTDGQSGISPGAGVNFNFKVGPLLVFDSAEQVFKTTQQLYGNAGNAPQMAQASAGTSTLTGPGINNGFNFFTFTSQSSHAHLTTTLYGNGTQTVDGPHAVYALPMQLGGAGLADSRPYYILLGRDISATDAVFVQARAVASAAETSGNGTWIVDTDGDWSTEGAWFANVPDAPGARALFGGTIFAPRSVALNSNRTVGRLTFDNANRYTINGAGTLTIDNTSGGGTIEALSGSHTIATPIAMLKPTTIFVGSFSATISLEGAISATNIAITKSGAGNVDLLNIRSAGLALNGGTVTVRSNGGSTGASRVGTLSVAGGATPLATLDLIDNDLIVTSGTYDEVSGLIRSARNNGTWSGRGITSSAARDAVPQANSLGAVTGQQYLSTGTSTFDGFVVASSDVLVKYTYYGDADFNGKVDGADYSKIDTAFNSNLLSGGWFNGDFDYNNKVDGADYALIDAAFNSQSGTLRRAVDFLSGDDRSLNGMNAPALQMVVQHYRDLGDTYGLAFITSVPEPGLIGLMSLGALLASAGKRRRR